MRTKQHILPALIASLILLFIKQPQKSLSYETETYYKNTEDIEYWFLLQRDANIEILYHGLPGNIHKSEITKVFNVKTGKSNSSPTPLPQLLDRRYWLITDIYDISGNADIGPYFLKLDIPYSTKAPYGPVPYIECEGQCNWKIPGSFGLHGVAGDNQKLSKENKGSFGCVRHGDEDITYIYNLLRANKQPIKYFIEDSTVFDMTQIGLPDIITNNVLR